MILIIVIIIIVIPCITFMKINEICNITVYRRLQHDCNADERYQNTLEVNMFKRQQNSQNQVVIIRSPKNLQQCRRPEYQWLFYNISPNICTVDIICETFKGGECGTGDYTLQLFTVDHWRNSHYHMFHNHNQAKGNGKICRKHLNHHRKVENGKALVIDLLLLADAYDLPDDSEFSCKVTYDCRKTKNELNEFRSTPGNVVSTSSVLAKRTTPFPVTRSQRISTRNDITSLVEKTTTKIETTSR